MSHSDYKKSPDQACLNMVLKETFCVNNKPIRTTKHRFLSALLALLLGVGLLWEPGAALSRYHVICPPLQLNTTLLQQLLVAFVWLREWESWGWLMVLLGGLCTCVAGWEPCPESGVGGAPHSLFIHQK